MKRACTLALFAFACGSDAAPDAALQVRVPADRRLFQSITSYALRAERDGRVLAQQTTPANGSTLSLGGVPFGQRTVFTLDGITSAGDLVARGSSCPMDFEPHGDPVVIYFSPVNFFAPTPENPTDTRMFPVALPLATGEIVIAGGQGSSGAVDSAETFSPLSADFAVFGSKLTTPRVHAEIIAVPGVGGLVIGGQGPTGAAGDLYDVSSQAFVPLTNSLLVAQSGHRMVTESNGKILIMGGSLSATMAMPTSQTVEVSFVGNAPQFTMGPPLALAVQDHAAAVVVGVPVVFGGTDGINETKKIQVLNGGQFSFAQGTLSHERRFATATTLNDGSALVVGGFVNPDCGAEIFNPVTQTSTCTPMANARVEHTATLLADGRVLVTGGTDLTTGLPLDSVELYVPGVGFVAERPLGTARHGHVAVPLCDGTVLVTGGDTVLVPGGKPTAEIYNPPASN